ncbi:hypothetical protein KSP40_PGU015782 [Platanthera guangdongensis]|uniref:Putative plant transposon protein domain-containing protein n=1 Tax=Platanthera guangdongensis TaxID=2320717 RepID=A0ABR2MVE9_9ASPA
MEIREWSRAYVGHIKALSWEIFCHPRTEAVLPWVYEFYANARFREGTTVSVRGKQVDFSAATINNFFELDDDTEGSLMTLQATVPPSEIATTVCCVPQPEWARRSFKAIKSTSLSREAKVWLLFINASILPTRHLNNISLDRLTLIYSILMGKRINMGRLIAEQLALRVMEDRARPLWFPTLITALCRLAGVGSEMGDLVTQVGHHITETMVEVNIKVAAETGEKRSKLSKLGGKEPETSGKPPSSAPMKLVIGRSQYEGERGLATENVEYIKAYLRCQHVYFESRFEDIRRNQEKLMHAAKIQVEAPSYQLQSQFDSEGYLLQSDWSRADPAKIAATASDLEEETDPEDEDCEDKGESGDSIAD